MKFIENPYICITIIFVLFIIITFVFKIDYMDIGRIVKNYFSNFKRTDGKTPIMITLLYFIMPLIMAWCCVNIKIIDGNIISNITVMLSIITAVLFTLLPMLLDIGYKMEDKLNENKSKLRLVKKLISETVDSIMFEGLLSVILLIISFMLSFPGMKNKIISCVVYYLLFIFLLNLMIVLKRFYVLFKESLLN